MINFAIMNWKIALLVAVITGVVTAIVTAPVANHVAGKVGVSDFEGKRGFAVAFLFIPAGFLGGALLGLLGTKLVHATEWPDFWKALGISVALGQAALFGISGSFLLGIPRPPRIDGKELLLELEVYVPLARITAAAREQDQIRLSLYAGPKDNAYAMIDRSLFREEDGQFIVTAVAPLNSRSYTRTVSFHIQDHTWLAADIELPATPGTEHMAWSALKPMRDARTSGSSSVMSDVRMRYRVVKP